MKVAYISGLVVGLVLVAGSAANARLGGTQTKIDREIALSQATPVRRGELTAKQRVHSQIHSRLVPDSLRQSVFLLAGRHQASEDFSIVLGVGIGSNDVDNETSAAFFRRLAADSDLVIRGSAIGGASQVTDDESLVFTDCTVIVKEIHKNNANAPVREHGVITVSRPGGKVIIDGRIVTGLNEAYLPLPVSGADVLLFLRYVPESGGYVQTRDTGAFALSGELARPLTEVPTPSGIPSGVRELVDEVRKASVGN